MVCTFSTAASAEIYTEDFSSNPKWSTGSVDNGQFIVNMSQWGRTRAIAPGLWFRNGTISVNATPTDTPTGPTYPPGYGSGVFGIMIKYNGPEHDLYVRFGAWNNITLDDQYAGNFVPVAGQTYQIDITVDGNQIGITIDGSPIPNSPFTVNKMVDEIGRVGLYTEASAAWDNLIVNGWEPHPHAMPRPVTGSSDLNLEFATYRADLADVNEIFPVHGTLHTYLRNNGNGAAVLDNVLLGDKNVDDLISSGRISWYSLRPYFIKPGEIGELIIRVNGFTRAQTLAVLEDPNFENLTTLTVVPTTGPPLKAIIPVTTKPEPLQINFMAFSQNLRTIYVYLQNNNKIYNDVDKEYTIKSVHVNGHDVTNLATTGSSKIADEVIPLVINLDTPLYEGSYTVVTVETFEGVGCGHTLRAIPSEFVINTPRFTLGCQRSHAESALDIKNHCNTASTWLNISDLQDNGLDHLIYSARWELGVDNYLMQTDSSYPDIVGNWYAEVDKNSPQYIFQDIAAVDSFYARDGTGYAFTTALVMRARSVMGKSYMQMCDGVGQSYSSGIFSYSPDIVYPLMDNFKWGEYRSSRRPFWPYFWDGEIVLMVDSATKEVFGPNPHTPRVGTPAERQIQLYANLMLGMKGVLGYWGYGAEEGSGFYIPGDILRIGLGGITYPDTTVIHGYDVPENYLIDIKNNWDATGHINAEMQTIGPWVAKSDVSYLGRIISAVPALAPNGNPAAETSALISGLDTIILIVLNLRIDATPTGGVTSYDPVDVTAGVTVPPWLQGQPLDVFSVDSSDTPGIITETYTTVGDELRFAYTALASKKIIVITSNTQVRSAMAATMAEMQSRLSKIAPLQ